MIERRRLERFRLALPARMKTITSKNEQEYHCETKDVSAAGVFVYTSEPFAVGTRFGMELTTSNMRIKTLTGTQSVIECEGSVVRSTGKGVAIHFDKECQFLS